MNKARRKILTRVLSDLEMAKDELMLAHEAEIEALDALPESIQEGEMGNKMQEAIDALEAAQEAIDEAVEQVEAAQD